MNTTEQALREFSSVINGQILQILINNNKGFVTITDKMIAHLIDEQERLFAIDNDKMYETVLKFLHGASKILEKRDFLYITENMTKQRSLTDTEEEVSALIASIL